MIGTPSAVDGHISAAASPTQSASSIVVTDRHLLTAASLLLLLPNVLFAVRLQPLPAVIMLVGAAIYVALVVRPAHLATSAGLSKPIAVPRLGLCVVLAFGLLILGGEGHFVFANSDWLWRDSVLADVGRGVFPPTYREAGETYFLRAPLGMYMLPALVGTAAGLHAAHAALLAQNGCLLALVLYLLATIAGRRALPVIVIFLSFSGLDILGNLLMWLKAGHGIASFVLPSHIESWSLFQYSSVITQLFWVPNHALPAYLLTLLVILAAKNDVALGELGIAMAASLFWSPFAFIGTLPFLVYFLASDARASIGSRPLWVAGFGAACFLPVAIYLKADAARVPHELLLSNPFVISALVLSVAIEIPHVAVVREMWTALDASLRKVLIVALAILVVLPFIRVGTNGDLAMRASIPALMFLAYMFAQALCAAQRQKRVGVTCAGLVLVVLGAVTPAQEIIRALTFSPYAISDCNLVTVWKKITPEVPVVENYLARLSLLPSWLMKTPVSGPLVNQSPIVCWPDIPYSPVLNITQMSNQMLLHAHNAGANTRF